MFNEIKEQLRKLNSPRRQLELKCSNFNEKEHLQMDYKDVKTKKYSRSQDCFREQKRSIPLNAPKEKFIVSALCGECKCLYFEGIVSGVPYPKFIDEGAHLTLLRTDIAQQLKELKLYTTPNFGTK
ncbi:hypothetical protein NPIL_532831 [Nephila pilipes]|uniref:Uncharacterized protein n=1 Tax=Nephila pilipes TaxID=299642 RepID=A0A8X6P312_NEPPI|nr:hypothetical protein NPIL_532831 [Nephila pilipes]